MLPIQSLSSDRATVSAFSDLETDFERYGLEQARAERAGPRDLAEALAEALPSMVDRARCTLEPDTGCTYPRLGYGLGREELAEALTMLEGARARAYREELEALSAEGADDLAPALLEGLSSLFGSSDDTVYRVEEAGGYSAVSCSNLDLAPKRPSAQDVAEALAEGAAIVYSPGAAQGSDYGGGGALGRSNCRALGELAEQAGGRARAFDVSGGHGTYGIVFDVLSRSAELASALEGLGDYPVVDDDLMSELESEEEQAFLSDCGGVRDFQRALEARIGLDDCLEDVVDSDLAELFWSLEPCFEHDSSGARIDVERLAEGAELDEIQALPGFKVPAEARAEILRAAEVVRAARAVILPAEDLSADAPPAEVARLSSEILDAEEGLRTATRREGANGDLAPGVGRENLERIFLQLADPRLPELLSRDRGHYLSVLSTWWNTLTGEEVATDGGPIPRAELFRRLRGDTSGPST